MNTLTISQIAAGSICAVAFLGFVVRWLYYMHLLKRRCPKCKKALMEKKMVPVHVIGPVEQMYVCPNCGNRAFRIIQMD